MKTLLLVLLFLTNPIFAKEDCSYRQKLRQEMGVSHLYEGVSRQRSVRIAVVDTNIYKSTCYQDAIVNSHELRPFPKREEILQHRDLHGSDVVSIIEAANPWAKIEVFPIQEEKLNSADYMKVLERAVLSKPDVLSLSIRSSDSDPQELKLLEKARELGIVVVIVAGNEKVNLDAPKQRRSHFPVNYQLDNFIVVSGYARVYGIYNWSSHQVDTFSGITRRHGISDGFSFPVSGTSLDVPVVSAVASLILQAGAKITPQQMKRFFQTMSIKKSELKGKSVSEGVVDYPSIFKIIQAQRVASTKESK